MQWKQLWAKTLAEETAVVVVVGRPVRMLILWVVWRGRALWRHRSRTSRAEKDPCLHCYLRFSSRTEPWHIIMTRSQVTTSQVTTAGIRQFLSMTPIRVTKSGIRQFLPMTSYIRVTKSGIRTLCQLILISRLKGFILKSNCSAQLLTLCTPSNTVEEFKLISNESGP